MSYFALQSTDWKLFFVKLTSSRKISFRCSASAFLRFSIHSYLLKLYCSRICSGRYFSYRTFFLLTLCYRYNRRREVSAILLLGNLRWKSTVRCLIVFPAHNYSVSLLIRKSICSWSSFLTTCLVLGFFGLWSAFLHKCYTVPYERPRTLDIIL